MHIAIPRLRQFRVAAAFVGIFTFAIAAAMAQPAALPPLDQVMKAKRDLWGEAAMQQPGGANYELFANLLPPLRYVNADFRYYPIVLSAPNAKVKVRLISNGSGINLRGGARSWNDNGTPMIFRVGPDEFQFGGELARLEHPTLTDGYLPIVQIRYLHVSPIGAEGHVSLTQQRVDRQPEVYELEAFASTDVSLSEYGVAFVKFSLAEGTIGTVTVQIDSRTPIKFAGGEVTNDKDQLLAYFDGGWKWDSTRARAKVSPTNSPTFIIATKPVDASIKTNVTAKSYLEQREACAQTWRKILSHSMSVQTPEPVVNNAWRHLLVENFELINGDRIHYSTGNQYDKLYESEGSDAMLAMLVWGYESVAKRLMTPLYDFTRKGLEFHQAGFKLNDLCRYYWQTRDPNVVRQFRSWPKPERYRTSEKEWVSGWQREARRLDESRTGGRGLYPKEQYCGDISTPVQTLNANSKAWRAMRDLSAVLAETGETNEATHYAEVASTFRKAVLTAIERSVRHETAPPFVPVALYTNEPPHDPICDTRIGSYWNIIIGYTIGSGIFPPGSPEENWIPQYQEQHGGLCMGMLRSGGMSNTFWNSEYKINPLYGTRYALDTLRRDDPDRALTCFYGMLAQGLTRNTFIGGEGCSLVPLDEGGRLFYCPPNSAANSHLLTMLRTILVQDWDLDDDGKPETLRLAFATPKRWMEDGKVLKVDGAPTAFGPVSFKLESHLAQGEVLADVDLPSRNQPKQTLLRIRVPDGWKVVSAQNGTTKLDVDAKGTVDLSSFSGKQTVRFRVQQ